MDLEKNEWLFIDATDQVKTKTKIQTNAWMQILHSTL